VEDEVARVDAGDEAVWSSPPEATSTHSPSSSTIWRIPTVHHALDA
jgi:hypothetical protein